MLSLFGLNEVQFMLFTNFCLLFTNHNFPELMAITPDPAKIPFGVTYCWWKKSGVHQLRLVVEIPWFTGNFTSQVFLWGFLNHQQYVRRHYQRPLSTLSSTQRSSELRATFQKFYPWRCGIHLLDMMLLPSRWLERLTDGCCERPGVGCSKGQGLMKSNIERCR